MRFLLFFLLPLNVHAFWDVLDEKEKRTPQPTECHDREQDRLWNRSGFGLYMKSQSEKNVSYPKDSVFTHSLKLSVVHLEKHGWTEEQVLSELDKVSAILAKCGIKLLSPHMVKSLPPLDDRGKEITSISVGGGRVAAREVEILSENSPQEAKPIIYFIKKFNNRPMGGTLYGEAWQSSQVNQGVAWENTALISHETQTPQVLKERGSSYSTTAHELGHILLNSGHTHGDEIMNEDSAKRKAVFSPAQCAQMKKSPLIKKL